MAEGDIDVVLKDDELPKDGAQPNGKDTTTQVVVEATDDDKVSDDIAEVQRKLVESERGRVAAENRAMRAEQRVGQAEATAFGSQMAIINGALETLGANRSTLRAQYKEAMAAGDFDKADEVNDQLLDLKIQENDLKKGKSALEQQTRTAQPDSTQLNDDQKVEAYVKGLAPRAAAWIKAHPDYVLDDRKRNRMIAQHHNALGEGLTEGSDEYFTSLEIGLGLARGSTQAQPTTAAPVVADPTAAAAQPVKTRQTEDVQPSPASPSRGSSTRTIRLTPAEQEAAQMSGMTPEEYARSREREKRAGNLTFTLNASGRKH